MLIFPEPQVTTVRVGMCGHKNDNIPVLSQACHNVSCFNFPLAEILNITNIEWNIDYQKLVLIEIILRQLLIDDRKMCNMHNGMKAEVK